MSRVTQERLVALLDEYSPNRNATPRSEESEGLASAASDSLEDMPREPPPAKQAGEDAVQYAHRLVAHMTGAARGKAVQQPTAADMAKVEKVRADMADMDDRGHVLGLIDGKWLRLPDHLVPEAWKGAGATPRTPAELSVETSPFQGEAPPWESAFGAPSKTSDVSEARLTELLDQLDGSSSR